ncbi:hypothetical protein ONV78_30525 [Hahella sp. CR1]|uniref:hypothetical protein n=1 Tax=Hahella sp. CR1 TaxID=2992807 RepID=UPI0024432BB1|nr:hypothetical protein [Hahella sp. CR1]MDG9672108.1 hypothetical protein [Hahella sp. CR1]
MHKDQAIEMQSRGMLKDVVVLPNPSLCSEWIILFKDYAGRSHFLLRDTGEVTSCVNLESIVGLLKEIGFRRAEIAF